MHRDILKHCGRMAAILALSVLLGILFLVLAFCLPTGPIKRHVAESADYMLAEEEEFRDNSIKRYIWGAKESYTDSIMVQYAFEKIPGKNAYEHAMWAYHSDLEDGIWAAEDSLKALLDGMDASQMHLREYSRYWHGYLVYLKPLLLLFSWRQVVLLGILFQAALMLSVFVVSARKGEPGVGILMLTGFMFMKPALVLVSLTMSVCWVITLTALLVMLLGKEKMEQKQIFPEFFLLAGICTAYFDFLTYPIVTLCFPLCAYFLIYGQSRVKACLRELISYCICWSAGYAGMWGMKWVAADITLHTGTIKDALWNVIGRTEAIGGRPRFNGGFYVISLNLQEYDSRIYPIAVCILTVTAFLLVLYACYKVGAGRTLAGMVPFLVCFCIPFAWIVVVQHHSALHARFTFRILSVAVLAVCCMGVRAVQLIFNKNPQNREKSGKK